MIERENKAAKYKLVKGVVLWLTGLPCSGKSTIAGILERMARESNLKAEFLDGDVVRQSLSHDLGFSREDRDAHIKRIGFVCQLLARNGVMVFASFVSPYREARDSNRHLIGAFVEIYVSASVEACERRDVKGLYKKARAGEIQGFTGISDPYEPPLHPEIICETEKEAPEESAAKIWNFLEQKGYLVRRSHKSII
ncbi:MAG: adenylyl-sulfate kinase [Candidatus Omnitrophica bacterium]|nr:adenylyl-sulfate kinase [Candidatus Omnitrophota bacterium]MDD5670321.1 adenylyl-sulfate kinase [Candidatus Omnitrophota bacterium]